MRAPLILAQYVSASRPSPLHGTLRLTSVSICQERGVSGRVRIIVSSMVNLQSPNSQVREHEEIELGFLSLLKLPLENNDTRLLRTQVKRTRHLSVLTDEGERSCILRMHEMALEMDRHLVRSPEYCWCIGSAKTCSTLHSALRAPLPAPRFPHPAPSQPGVEAFEHGLQASLPDTWYHRKTSCAPLRNFAHSSARAGLSQVAGNRSFPVEQGTGARTKHGSA